MPQLQWINIYYLEGSCKLIIIITNPKQASENTMPSADLKMVLCCCWFQMWHVKKSLFSLQEERGKTTEMSAEFSLQEEKKAGKKVSPEICLSLEGDVPKTFTSSSSPRDLNLIRHDHVCTMFGGAAEMDLAGMLDACFHLKQSRLCPVEQVWTWPQAGGRGGASGAGMLTHLQWQPVPSLLHNRTAVSPPHTIVYDPMVVKDVHLSHQQILYWAALWPSGTVSLSGLTISPPITTTATKKNSL